MNKVELTYNPYKDKSSMVINGRSISPYSEIAKYLSEPFNLWCEKIFAGIARELNDDYELHFTARTFEKEILKKLSVMENSCINFLGEDYSITQTLYDRFRIVECVHSVKRHSIAVILHSDGSLFTDDIVQHFVNIEMFYPSDYENIFETEDYPLSKIYLIPETHNTSLGREFDRTVTMYFCTSDLDDAAKNQLLLENNNIYILKQGAGEGFERKKGNLYFFNFNESNLADIVFNIIEFEALTPIFKNDLNFIRSLISTNQLDIDDILIETFELVDNIEPVIKIECQSILDIGRTYSLNINCYPAHSVVPELSFEYSRNGIVHCTGGTIKALSVGTVTVDVYKPGCIEPLTRFNVNVIKRNLISSISFPDAYNIGLGDTAKLNFTMMPSNPENLYELSWVSSNDEIISVDSEGNITANSLGQCQITLSTPDVSSSCIVYVKPKVSEIDLSSSYLNISVGDTIRLDHRILPEDAIDIKSVKTWCSNQNVISFQNGIITAIASGEAKITFYTEDNRVSRTCNINVKGRKGILGIF